MNDVAVLSNGPSLHQTWSLEKSERFRGLVVAVNAACWIFPCDWACYTDRIIYDEHRRRGLVQPRIGWASRKGEMTTARLPLWRTEVCRYSHLLPAGSPKDICGYTFPAALAFAQHLAHGGVVYVHGFDCSDKPNVTGFDVQHGWKRWRAELPWVRHSWADNVRNCSPVINPAINGWLEGNISWERLERVMSEPAASDTTRQMAVVNT